MNGWTEESFYGQDGVTHVRLVHASGAIVADALTGVLVGYDDPGVLADAVAAGDVVVDGRDMVAVP